MTASSSGKISTASFKEWLTVILTAIKIDTRYGDGFKRQMALIRVVK